MHHNRIFRLAILLIVLVSLTATQLPSPAHAQTGWQWYKTDTHVHSSVSADGFNDIGIHSQAAIEYGYNALFLTDHDAASNQHDVNHRLFADSYSGWTLGTYGSLSTTINELATSPVHTGSKSLHLKSSSSTSGETYIWDDHGPNFRHGDIILKVSIYPTRIDPGSGLYVSVSIGGDPTVLSSPDGYTTTAGVVSPGKTTVLVWQLGSGRAPSSDPNTRVLAYSLGSYTLNTWNTYTINVSSALADIPLADRPLDYNRLSNLKIAAIGNGGTVEGYFDTYSLDASAPLDPAGEFVYRTSIVDDFNTSTFKVFPSVEMGEFRHSNRFNFGITSPSEHSSYTNGTDGILETHQSGYPVQLNHPGTSVTHQEVIDNLGYGADFLEVRGQERIDTWNAILQQGVQLIGTWSTDTHTKVNSGRGATYIYAPALDFDKLMQSLYEGRTYNALNNFSGRLILNVDSASQEPYPARYPIYVSDAQASANVHLRVTADLENGNTMQWYRNGILTATDNQTAASYDATKSISLTGAFTYVRAEVRLSTDIEGLTQPIFFVDVPGLPVDKSFHVDKVTTANGKGYNILLTKGIISSNWNAANSALSMTLENPVGALVNLLVTSNSAPQQVMVNGASIAASSTLTNFEAATNSAWYYDAPADLLYLKVKHTAAIANAVIGFGGALPTPTITPTPSITPTSTGTATPTLPASNNPLYASFGSNGTVGGVAFSDEDIVMYDGQSWSLLFDGSDVSAAGDLFGFSIMDADTILVSFDTAQTLNGVAITPQDVVRFDATSLGSFTSGTFSMYLNGIDVGLDTANETLDAVSLLPDGRVLISTTSTSAVPGVGGTDEDVLAFTPTSLGANTSGSWAMYFDGSDVGLADTSSEDVDALDVDPNGNIYLSTTGDFAVTGVSGSDEDVFICSPTSLGSVTGCNYSPTLYFDGNTWGQDANNLDAFELLISGSFPTATPSNTPNPTNTPTPTNTSTPTHTPTVGPSPTPTLPPSSNPLYASFGSNGSVGGVAFADEDILRFDGSAWSLLFDGSDVGVSSTDVFGFSVVDADTLLLAFDKSVTVGGLTFAPTDVARFDATSLGSVTAGTFSMYLNGIDVGLDATSENIDSVTLLSDGRVLISTTGNPSVAGVIGTDEDILAFTPTTLGNATSGTWAMYFDGSDVGLADTTNEDVDALDVDPNGNIYLSTIGDFAVTGVAGFDEDVFVCAPTSLGSVTACNYSSDLYFDGSTWGQTANDLDAFNFLSLGPVPTVTPLPTLTKTPTPSQTFTPTASLTPTPTFTPTATLPPSLTPTATETATIGPSPTPTNTPTDTPTFTPTNTPTVTLTPSLTPTFTASPTASSTPVPTFTYTPTATFTPSPTSAVTDLIFADGFESGDLSAWSSATTGGGDLSVSASAALTGTLGMQVLVNDPTDLFVTDNTPNVESHYRARFYFDPNGMVLAESDSHPLLSARDTATVFHVDFRWTVGTYQIRLRQYNDGDVLQSTGWVTISDAPHYIEVEWWAATAAGANDGGMILWIDGVQRKNLASLDNDLRRIDSVSFGAPSSIDAGTQGTYYLDAFESRRQTYIGP